MLELVETTVLPRHIVSADYGRPDHVPIVSKVVSTSFNIGHGRGVGEAVLVFFAEASIDNNNGTFSFPQGKMEHCSRLEGRNVDSSIRTRHTWVKIDFSYPISHAARLVRPNYIPRYSVHLFLLDSMVCMF